MVKRLGPRIILALALLLSLPFTVMPASATDAAWERLQRGGYVILMQGADVSGTLSPRVDNSADCSAGQTLTDRGHQLAQKAGALFAAWGGRIERVLTSAACNARETARLAFESIPAEIFQPLEALPTDDAAKQAQLDQIRATIIAFKGAGNLVMLTDKANITALTGIVPRPTEAVIVNPAPDGAAIHVAGRIIFD
jgi:hypothetical protein